MVEDCVARATTDPIPAQSIISICLRRRSYSSSCLREGICVALLTMPLGLKLDLREEALRMIFCRLIVFVEQWKVLI